MDGKSQVEQELNQLDGEINEIISAVNGGATVVDGFKSHSIDDINVVQAQLDRLHVEMERSRKDGLATAHAIENMVQRSYGLLNQVLGIFGQSISGVLGAIVQAAFMTAGTILALAQAESITPGMWFNAAMSFVSAGLALTAAIKADMERSRVEKTIVNVQRNTTRATRLVIHV